MKLLVTNAALLFPLYVRFVKMASNCWRREGELLLVSFVGNLGGSKAWTTSANLDLLISEKYVGKYP